MSGPPRPPSRVLRRRTLKWVGVAVAAPSVLLVVLIAAFVARSELAHDEARCPFQEVERREVSGDVFVVDERRRCEDAVEEHRWVVIHRGPGTPAAREIGRRRLPRDEYSAGRYSWRASSRDGWVRLQIHNEGVESATFREGPE